jgi:SMC interacting uncharacterized protein involved in chromosome segregation
MLRKFDSHEIFNASEQAGFTRKESEFLVELAEIQIQYVTESIVSNLATKNDLEKLESGLKSDIERLELDLKSDIKEVKIENKALNGKLSFIITLISLLGGLSILFGSGLPTLLHIFGK